ncbi:permease, partial [Micromonospora sp. 15K316]
MIRERIGSVEILTVLLLLLLVMSERLTDLLAAPALATWTTVFVSVMVQAVPFLVFGVLLSAAIAVFVPRSFWARALP